MKIHVLVYGSAGNLSSTVRTDLSMLRDSAEKLGHEIEIIHSRDCQLKFTGKPKILVDGKPPRAKILLVRANFLHKDLEIHASLIKQFEMSNVKVVNKHSGVIKAKNKVHTLQTLAKNGVPMPKTYVVRSADYIEDVVKDFGTYPVILKNISGSHGLGVAIVESKRGMRSIVEMLTESGGSNPLIVQEYVKESKGKDIRVFILGKRIIAAMERVATKRGEFRSNFKLGGRVRVAELTRKEKDIAFAAVAACGLDMAGVDILRTKKGPKVLEVNANPGLEGITKATGRDVAGEIIKFAAKRARR
ncbi:RimK family alpha-L-glutamate ligase [Candidatus Nomurabacteria bacterium]|nr:RimK family alpha-L-glutamate ligase [Candidatus Nomurabacteria bacterium]